MFNKRQYITPYYFYTYLKCTAKNRRCVCTMTLSNSSWEPPGHIKERTKEKLHPLHQNMHLKINLKWNCDFRGKIHRMARRAGGSLRTKTPNLRRISRKKWTLPRLIYRVLLTPLPINQNGLCSLQKKKKRIWLHFFNNEKRTDVSLFL